MKHRPVDSDEVRRLLQLTNQSRDLTFETRNIMSADLKRLREMSDAWKSEGPHCVPMSHDELEKATEAVFKAADEAAKTQTILHRNLMTLLGYRVSAEESVPQRVSEGFDLSATVHRDPPDLEQTQVIPVVQ